MSVFARSLFIIYIYLEAVGIITPASQVRLFVLRASPGGVHIFPLSCGFSPTIVEMRLSSKTCWPKLAHAKSQSSWSNMQTTGKNCKESTEFLRDTTQHRDPSWHIVMLVWKLATSMLPKLQQPQNHTVRVSLQKHACEGCKMQRWEMFLYFASLLLASC